MRLLAVALCLAALAALGAAQTDAQRGAALGEQHAQDICESVAVPCRANARPAAMVATPPPASATRQAVAIFQACLAYATTPDNLSNPCQRWLEQGAANCPAQLFAANLRALATTKCAAEAQKLVRSLG